jgi:UDP-GlcNAc:undecaprenyl-phosphate GlcNAc-1-phosphate transferase
MTPDASTGGAVALAVSVAVLCSILAAISAAAAARAVRAGRPPRLMAVATNHRGRRVPVVLGIPLLLVLACLSAAERLGGSASPLPPSWSVTLLAGMLAVFAAGYADDLQADRIRGLRTHVTLLLRGRLTTGIGKLAAAVAAALAWTLVSHASFPRVLFGVPVIAGCANLWNLFDVAPGRALKAGLLASIGLSLGRPSSLAALCAGASAGLLVADVRERAMLGDGGANVLGFTLGVLLFERLATPGLAVAATAIVGLHLLAETVTLSRIIRAVAPLRWFDDLGRIPVDEPEG